MLTKKPDPNKYEDDIEESTIKYVSGKRMKIQETEQLTEEVKLNIDSEEDNQEGQMYIFSKIEDQDQEATETLLKA